MTEAKPSKSARKREHLELQKLGEALIPLSDGELEPMPLDERLLEAIRAARGMRSHGALRRQKQLIGKLMRGADVQAIRAVLDARNSAGLADKQRFAAAERWRDRLVAEGRTALPAFAEATGRDDDGLAGLLDELERAAGEKQLKHIRKQLFRRIHALLAEGG